jgi:hypothetical protein
MVSTLQHSLWGAIIYLALKLFNVGSFQSYDYLIIFVLLTQIPDFDLLIYLFKRNDVDHRTYFHNIFFFVRFVAFSYL